MYLHPLNIIIFTCNNPLLGIPSVHFKFTVAKRTLISFAAIWKVIAMIEFPTKIKTVFRQWSDLFHHNVCLVDHHRNVNSTPVPLGFEAVCMHLDQPYGMWVILEAFGTYIMLPWH